MCHYVLLDLKFFKKKNTEKRTERKMEKKTKKNAKKKKEAR